MWLRNSHHLSSLHIRTQRDKVLVPHFYPESRHYLDICNILHHWPFSKALALQHKAHGRDTWFTYVLLCVCHDRDYHACWQGECLAQVTLRGRDCFSMAQLQPRACRDVRRAPPPSSCSSPVGGRQLIHSNLFSKCGLRLHAVAF